MKSSMHILITRLAIGLVLLWNVQCALAFIFWPARFSAGFEIANIPGEAALRGVGVLFLMWNIPYVVALWHPVRYRVSLYEATAMQALGLLGETLILLGLPPGHNVLQTSLLRFIAFDAAGLLLLILANGLVRRATLQVKDF